MPVYNSCRNGVAGVAGYSSPGDSGEQLVEGCGNPVSRDGADWTFEMRGSL